MCEFLIRIKAKAEVDTDFVSPVRVAMNDVSHLVRSLHKGDVVVVCADGWPWSHTERNNPEWRIVKVPGMSVEEGQALESAEPSTLTRGEMLRRRAFSLHVHALKSEMTKAELMAAAQRKAPLIDQKRM